MPIIAKYSQKEFTPAPEGLHQGVCIDVVDLGLVTDQYGEKHKVQIRWELVEQIDDVTGLPFMVSSRYNLSLHEKATLRKHLEMWRGRKFTAEELGGFDLEKLIGANCQIQVAHNFAADGQVWANVLGVMPLHPKMTKVRPSDTYTRVKDRPKSNGTGAAPAGKKAADDDEVPF